MASKKAEAGSLKLLEAWEPPEGAGDPVGCIATTFTFDPVFFEEHCLSRFLRLETDPREDRAAYLIEREEKLASTCVSVLVDRSTAEGSASPRWDVLPVPVPRGILHAKISVLAWHNWIRVLIGSANLTEPAYRKNQEIMGVLDFRDGGEAPIEILGESLRFVEGMAALAPGRLDGLGPKTRLLALVRKLFERSQGWRAVPLSPRESPQVVPIFLGPIDQFRTPILVRLGQLARERGGPATEASVLSPFFDQASGPTYPGTTSLLVTMTDRGQRSIQFLIPSERLPDGRIRLRAPKSLLRSARKTAEYSVYPIVENVENEVRPIHAKSIWLRSSRWHVYMIGSSNFTSAGLGLMDHPPNVEANLAYLFPDEGPLVRRGKQTLPPIGDRLEELESALWEPLGEDESEDTQPSSVLPVGFEEALFAPDETGGLLELHFGPTLPLTWTVSIPGSSVHVYSESQHIESSCPSEVRLPWHEKLIPTALEVQWRNNPGQTCSAP